MFYSGLKRGKARQAALDSWLHSYTRALPLLESHVEPGNLLRVSYEDSRPIRRANCAASASSSVAYDAQMLDFRARAHHVLAGNDMRLDDSGTIKVDAAWRNRLTRDELDYFERRAGTINRALGYE